jgi:hypothetical protein
MTMTKTMTTATREALINRLEAEQAKITAIFGKVGR